MGNVVDNHAGLLAPLSALAAGALLLWALADAGARVAPHWFGGTWQQPGTQVKRPVAGATAAYDARELATAHLFGVTDAVAAATPRKLPATRLSLQLGGIIASTEPRLARAVIGVNAAAGKSYAIGQRIEGTDASLYGIERHRVIIQRGDKLESVVLTRPLLGQATAGAHPSTGRPVIGRHGAGRPRPTPAAPVLGRAPTAARAGASRARGPSGNTIEDPGVPTVAPQNSVLPF